MKLAVFLPNWVGDLVMATPTLRALRRHFSPPTRIVGILRPHLAELLSGTDWFDELWYFDPRAKHSEWGRLALVHRLRQARFDQAVLLTNSFHTAVMAWLGRVRRRTGYVQDLRGALLTQRLYQARDGRKLRPQPMVEVYLALAQAVGCPPESSCLELRVTDAERRQGERIWHELGLRTDGRVIALNSSGAYGAAKVWPVDHCSDLARQIVQHLDHDVLVLCGPQERQAAREVVRIADSPRVLTLPDEAISLSATKACLARCRLLVSTDSGPRHMAAALGKPVVTLLGPTIPAWIANPTIQGTMLRADLDCLGCSSRVCPLGHHRCMLELTPDRVLAEVEKLLAARSVQAA